MVYRCGGRAYLIVTTRSTRAPRQCTRSPRSKRRSPRSSARSACPRRARPHARTLTTAEAARGGDPLFRQAPRTSARSRLRRSLRARLQHPQLVLRRVHARRARDPRGADGAHERGEVIPGLRLAAGRNTAGCVLEAAWPERALDRRGDVLRAHRGAQRGRARASGCPHEALRTDPDRRDDSQEPDRDVADDDRLRRPRPAADEAAGRLPHRARKAAASA